MTFTTQTINDAQGNPLWVQIPYAEWKAFQDKKLAQRKARELKALENDLREAFAEVKAAKNGGAPLLTVEEFFADF